MRNIVARAFRLAVQYLPLALMAWGVGFGLFVYGVFVGEFHRTPFNTIDQARIATEIAWNKLFDSNRVRELGEPSDVPAADVAKHRIVAKHTVDDGAAFLLTGGEAQFLEFCPEHGCAAVILDRGGNLIHAYPYRPDELKTKRTLDLPYGQLMHDDSKDTTVIGLAPLSNGELIVVYDFAGTSPYGGGIARMDKAGHLLWYRRDYSDHWPTITPKNEILDITHRIGPGRIRIRFPIAPSKSLVCRSEMLVDIVNVLDFDGHVKETIPVFDALLASPYWTRLLVGIDPDEPNLDTETCDPIHANSVVEVGPELAARLQDVEPNDLLLSLREVSALVIIGRTSHTVKHMFTGSFLFQHSAQTVSGGNILLFDNFGSSAAGGPSRVLLYDPLTGKEQTIFPNKHTPRNLEIFSHAAGNINLSEDGTRALFTVALAGKAYEISLTDGRLLTTFENLHDVHSLPQFANDPKPVRYFTEFGVYYVSPHLAD